MSYREQEVVRTAFSSIGDLQRYLKKQEEDYRRGYIDYLKQHQTSAYQRGREQAARDLVQERLSKNWWRSYWY